MSESIDVSKLDIATIVDHLANPRGSVGRAVIATLNKPNAGGYSAAFATLGLRDNDRVLEIGFGNGREIPRLLSLASGLTYIGLEISETMIVEASEFNAEAIGIGRVRLIKGSSDSIAAEPKSFDKGLVVHTTYFWPDPLVDLRELRRVIRDGGRLVLCMVAPASAVGRPLFEHGYGFYEQHQIRALLIDAGFSSVSIDTLNETVVATGGRTWNRDCFIVSAE